MQEATILKTISISSFSLLLVAFSFLAAELPCCADESIQFSEVPAENRETLVSYRIDIKGAISTPGSEGVRKFPLASAGRFEYQQRQFASQQTGPFSLSAVRYFRTAETETTVGSDHTTMVRLPIAQRKVEMTGTGDRLEAVCQQSRLDGKHLDLLQMPYDSLVVSHLLTSSPVAVGDKWNTSSWVVPMLLGVDAVVEQQATCELQSLEAGTATILIEGSIEGAVRGSATKIEFRGEMAVDAESSMIRRLKVSHSEERSPGPVSPGLKVAATIEWTQNLAESTLSGDGSPPKAPGREALLLALQTPLKLRLMHSREWHLFHETPTVLMMRQLREGSLISQCNISSIVTVPPGEHTPDAEFREDVEESVKERKGAVVGEETVRDDGRWRIRKVSATGRAGEEVIGWDYYLCSAASGEQYSIVFSCAESDRKAFGDEASKLLSTLSIARRRLALPYR